MDRILSEEQLDILRDYINTINIEINVKDLEVINIETLEVTTLSEIVDEDASGNVRDTLDCIWEI